MQAGAAAGGTEVQRDAALAGVEEKEEAAVFRIREVAAERTAPAGNVAGWRLDLDYVGAEVGQYPGGKGRGHSFAAFDDRDPRQRPLAALGIGQS